MEAFAALAPAKLNLALHITGKRADGYHLMESLIAFADVGDGVCVRPAETLSLDLTGPFADRCGANEDNLILRAARRLAEYLGETRGAHITLDKQLPVGAGLGGGSSDAATACLLLLKLWARILPRPQLADLLLPLGADIPMCVMEAPLIARGIGEELEPLPDFPTLYAVLCWPGVALPTAQVYARYSHTPHLRALQPDTSSAVALLASLEQTRNMLQRPAIAACAEVAEALLVLETLPQRPFVRMSGSGAACVAYTERKEVAERIAAQLRERYPHWWIRCAGLKGITR